MFRSIAAGSKLAVQRRYNLNLFLSVLPVPYRALQSDRCLVVTFTAVTRVQIPSGTPNIPKNLADFTPDGLGSKRFNSAGMR